MAGVLIMKIIESKKLNASVHLSDDGRTFIRITDYFHDLCEGWFEHDGEYNTVRGCSYEESEELDNHVL